VKCVLLDDDDNKIFYRSTVKRCLKKSSDLLILGSRITKKIPAAEKQRKKIQELLARRKNTLGEDWKKESTKKRKDSNLESMEFRREKKLN
jgi:hypothetical protein